MFKFLLVVMLYACLASTATAFATDKQPAAVDLAIYKNGQRLHGKILYWADKEGVSPARALLDGSFQPLKSQKIVFGAKKHWYLLKIGNRTEHPLTRLLATGLPTTPELVVRPVTDRGLGEPLFKLYAEDAFDARPVNSPLLFIPLSLSAQTDQLLLIEHRSLANYPLILRLFNEDTLQTKMAIFTLIRGVVFGALLVFLILFVVQSFSAPNKSLIFYCCYIGCLLLLVGQVFGFNFTYLWPRDGEWNQAFTPFVTGMTYGFYFLFSATIFDLRQHNIALYRVIIGLAIAAFVLSFLTLFFGVFIFMVGIALVGLPVPVIIGWWARKQHLSAANLFLAGSILHCSLSYLLALECLGIHLGYGYYLFSFLSVGQIFDLALFSIAILRQAHHLKRVLHEQLEQRVQDAEALALAEQEKAAALSDQRATALALASATHDMTQPLAAMRFALALVDDDKSSFAKSHIIETLDYTEQLLKTLTKDGEAQYQSASQTVDAQSFLIQVVERHSAAVEEKGLVLRSFSHRCQFTCMPMVVQRALDNLLANAARYTLSGSIALTLRARQHSILLQVWDTGIGMEPEQAARLMAPFEQADKNADKGFGLGLFIVKTLVEQAGYSLSIRSEKGRGSCVSVHIPKAELPSVGATQRT